MDNQQNTGADVSVMREQLDALTREVKYISMQSTSMFESFEDKLTALKREFSYLNQQNLSVYNMTTGFVEEALEKSQAALEEKIAALHEAIATMGDDGSVIPAVEVVVDHDRIAEGVARKLSDKSRKGVDGEEEEEIESIGMGDAIDYDTLAEKVAENIPPMDYDYLALKIANNMAAADNTSLADEVAQKVAEAMPKDEGTALDVSPEAIAESVVARMQDTVLNLNTESLAESVADKVVTGIATMDVEGFASAVAEKVAGESLTDVNVDTDAVVDALMSKLQDTTLELDVDNLANSLAERIQVPPLEVDVQELAAGIAEKIDLSGVKVDVDELAENIASRIEPATVEIDYDLVAARILEALPEVDYDTMSASLAEKLNGNEEDVEAYLAERGIEVDETDSSDRVITAVEENSGKTNALVEEVIELLKGKQFVAVTEVEEEEPVEEPVQELVDEPAEEVEEVVEVVAEPAVETVDEVSIAEAVAETAAMAEEAEDAGKALRLKRSYECKLRQSDDDVKYYYSEIKNELLAYAKVKSSLSWNGDRFNLGRETVAKIGINGKTLCLYLALNPDEYSITKYHQKYVGDVKAYESTPMMLKVKSSMGLKKAIALIIEMMEGLKATRKHTTPVDYTAEFGFKSDEQLIAEGLIKVSITEKKDLQSF